MRTLPCVMAGQLCPGPCHASRPHLLQLHDFSTSHCICILPSYIVVRSDLSSAAIQDAPTDPPVHLSLRPRSVPSTAALPPPAPPLGPRQRPHSPLTVSSPPSSPLPHTPQTLTLLSRVRAHQSADHQPNPLAAVPTTTTTTTTPSTPTAGPTNPPSILLRLLAERANPSALTVYQPVGEAATAWPGEIIPPAKAVGWPHDGCRSRCEDYRGTVEVSVIR